MRLPSSQASATSAAGSASLRSCALTGLASHRQWPCLVTPGTRHMALTPNPPLCSSMNSNLAFLAAACSPQLRQPDHISWAVWDSKWPEEIPASLEYGGGMAWDQDFRPLGAEWTAEREEETAFSWERDEDEILFQADTLEELADVMGFDAESKQTFLETVAHYNELVEAGVDPDFGKRPELLKISSITEPPFFALHMATEFGVTVGGLMTDVEGNVLDESGRGIPGLYAIGTVTGTLFGVDYNETTVPGISLGRNLTFGWLMGKHLATL